MVAYLQIRLASWACQTQLKFGGSLLFIQPFSFSKPKKKKKKKINFLGNFNHKKDPTLLFLPINK
jgi:hypothetical protein